MSIFGKRMAEIRKERGISQKELAQLLNTSISVISRYERGEITPSIEAGKNIAQQLKYYCSLPPGEAEEMDLFKDPEMLRRLREINQLPEEDKRCILYNIDAVLRDVKTRKAYA